jgi:penicillin-binding protein 2
MSSRLRPPGPRVEQPSARSTGGKPPTLTPKVALRIAILGGIALTLLGVLIMRLWFLQVISSEAYAAKAEGNRLRTVVDEGPRGNILDRHGAVIVGTRPSYNLVIRPQDVPEDRKDGVLDKLAVKLRVPRKDLDAKVEEGEKTPYQETVLDTNVPVNLRRYIAERPWDFPGISLKPTFIRDYRDGRLAAHVLGYTGPIFAEQVDAYRKKGYLGNERVGKTGMEAEYEQWLRGKAGERKIEVDVTGQPVGERPVSVTSPQPGNDLMLSIDLKTQRALESAIQRRVDGALYSTGGAGVALNPKTGEVLALASYDTFRPAAFADGDSKEIERYYNAKSDPLTDRATTGLYAAGSTFKIVSAIAGLEGDYIQPTQLIDSPSTITIYKQPFSNFRQEHHGLVDLPTALEVSSDTYFYQLGKKFYETKGRSPLKEMARQFGFDEPTGIDLPDESAGTVPDPAWLKEHFSADKGYSSEWRNYKPGYDIQLAVGQGFLQVTPLQMAVAYAAIANGGTIVTPTIGKKVLGPGGRELQDLAGGKPSRRLDVDPSNIEAVQQGLWLAAHGPDGTSTAVFGNVPVDVAGKTGTAEAPPGEDHSWYVGYAPFDNPEIVVAIVIERAGTGASSAAPAVCETMAAYFSFDPARCGSQAEAN